MGTPSTAAERAMRPPMEYPTQMAGLPNNDSWTFARSRATRGTR